RTPRAPKRRTRPSAGSHADAWDPVLPSAPPLDRSMPLTRNLFGRLSQLIGTSPWIDINGLRFRLLHLTMIKDVRIHGRRDTHGPVDRRREHAGPRAITARRAPGDRPRWGCRRADRSRVEGRGH